MAIEIPDEIQQKIRVIQEELKSAGVDAKWVKPENIHLTLVFLGDTDYTLIPKIVESLGKIRSEKLKLTCLNLGGFPNLEKPHNLWVGFKENEEIIHFQEKISKILKAADIQFDDSRKFKPHVTFARIKKSRNLENIVNKISKKDFPCFPVKEIILFESELLSDGPKHTLIKTLPLGD